MYRLLIVDDEANITDALYEVFQNKSGLELEIYKAYSGMEALSLLDTVRIDVVLSDIHMPGMNGIELLKEIRNKWPECRVVFLTGYTEFDYVYSAIQYQGVSYLLKTESFTKIIETVKDSILDIENSLKAKEILQKADEQIKYAAEFIKKEYLSGIVRGEYSSEEINQEEHERLNIALSAEQPVLILIGKVDEFPKGASYSVKSKLICTIKLITEQYLNININCTHFTEENLNLIWLIQPDIGRRNEDDFNAACNKIIIFIKGSLELVQSACMEAIGVSTSFVLDDSYVKWEEISQRFQRLKMFLDFRLGQGKGMLITNKGFMKGDLQDRFNSSEENIGISRFTIAMFQISLDNRNAEDFTRILNILTDKLASIRHKNYFAAHELYYAIALIFLSYINKWGLAERIGMKIELHKLMHENEHRSWSDAANYLKKLGDIIFDTQDHEQEIRTQDVIKKVQAHIDNNIGNADEITLLRLADLVHFNQSYLSRLYKQVTGTNLTEYVSDSRMRKAKELLGKGEIKIQEIAETLGFASPTNFARFFKKYAGLTPQEYRELILSRRE